MAATCRPSCAFPHSCFTLFQTDHILRFFYIFQCSYFHFHSRLLTGSSITGRLSFQTFSKPALGLCIALDSRFVPRLSALCFRVTICVSECPGESIRESPPGVSIWKELNYHHGIVGVKCLCGRGRRPAEGGLAGVRGRSRRCFRDAFC